MLSGPAVPHVLDKPGMCSRFTCCHGRVSVTTEEHTLAFSLKPEDDALQEALRGLAGLLLTEQSTDDVLAAVVSLAAQVVPGCDAASISMLHKGRPVTPVSSADLANDLDHSQYESGEGPCLTAIESAAPVRVESFAREQRWPRFSKQAAAEGVRSVLSLPLRVQDTVLGALNLYSRRPSNFSDAEDSAALFAHQASITLFNAQALRQAQELAQQLAVALENRDVIGQAKGIIMAAQNLSSDQAFDVLRRASQRGNRKLHEVAREIVERRDGAGPRAHPSP